MEIITFGGSGTYLDTACNVAQQKANAYLRETAKQGAPVQVLQMNTNHYQEHDKSGSPSWVAIITLLVEKLTPIG